MLLAVGLLVAACAARPGKEAGEWTGHTAAGVPPAGESTAEGAFVTEYLTPVRIVRVEGAVEGADRLLEPYSGQVSTREESVTRWGREGSVLLDFGKEIQGGIRLVRTLEGSKKAARFRLCLGESVSEALSRVEEPGTTATNDHSVRDLDISVPWLGSVQVGGSGFRFARLDLVDGDGSPVSLAAVQAVSRYRDLPYLGSFRCSDERLEKIWQTGAYTVHLCMQDYLWDGIKRDRLVWMGDMHPEIMTLHTVFGNQEVVRKSLDYVRDVTPPEAWMNGMCSYSLWWIIIQHHLYQWYGDKAYLQEQQACLRAVLRHVTASLEDDHEAYREGRFLDWPSNDRPDVIHAGLQALTVSALEAGSQLAAWLEDRPLEEECRAAARRLRAHVPSDAGSSQAAALLSLAGLQDPEASARVILQNGPEGCTSFMGYYLLEALSAAGRYAEAMQLVSDYWGRMLDLGATTFWEDFNYRDGREAARIDEIVPPGRFDIHADGGAWCYVGLRHSLCHGWASGPTAWLSRHVLGIEPVGVGLRSVRIEPHLGDLDWAEGTFPTPYGLIRVSHRKDADGRVVSDVRLPRGVKRIR